MKIKEVLFQSVLYYAGKHWTITTNVTTISCKDMPNETVIGEWDKRDY